MVMLYYPVVNIEIPDSYNTWREFFFAICDEPKYRLSRNKVDIIKRIDEALQT